MKPWTALPAAALALFAAACSGNSSPTSLAAGTPTASTTPSTSSSASPSDPLNGTWQTEALPTDTWVATFRRAGAAPADVAGFAAALASAGTKHQYLIRVLDGQWAEFEQHDGGTPSVGWDGTYSVTGDHVLATEKGDGCHVTYQIALSGNTLSVRVLSDLPESPPRCGRVDTWFQRAIYETSVFHRQH
jgi:hypothetical protein